MVFFWTVVYIVILSVTITKDWTVKVVLIMIYDPRRPNVILKRFISKWTPAVRGQAIAKARVYVRVDTVHANSTRDGMWSPAAVEWNTKSHTQNFKAIFKKHFKTNLHTLFPTSSSALRPKPNSPTTELEKGPKHQPSRRPREPGPPPPGAVAATTYIIFWTCLCVANRYSV